jgi:predicted metal-dependent phosphoesterase TrpH
MYKVDLHSHSVASPDGGISPDQYAKILGSERLDYIAITDHDRVDFALGLQQALGDKIIVGEEITTSEGEMVGLYLKSRVEPGQTALATAHAIRDQGGLVYIPHPFETVRKGMQRGTLDQIAELVDIVEVHNGRALTKKHAVQAAAWAKANGKAGASSSDAHGYRGLGFSYSITTEKPSRGSLVEILKMTNLAHRRAPFYTLLYPKFNRLKKMVGLNNA